MNLNYFKEMTLSEDKYRFLLEYSRNTNVDLEKILKEYYIIKILEFFSLDSRIKDSIVLKGGTCLSLFYESGRYSEDIDLDISEESNSANKVTNYFSKLNKEFGTFFNFHTFTPTKIKGDFLIPGYRDSYGETLRISFDIALNNLSTKELRILNGRLNSLMNIAPFKFPCIPINKIYAAKLAAATGRNKGRDFFDLNYLIDKKFTLDLDYFEYIVRLNGEKNIMNQYSPEPEKITLEKTKLCLLEKLISLEKDKAELFADLNDFLPIEMKITEDFILELYDKIDNKFVSNADNEDEFKVTIDQDAFIWSNLDTCSGWKSIQEFLEGFSSKNKKIEKSLLRLKGKESLINIPVYHGINIGDFLYEIVNNKGILVKRFKNKTEVAQYLYDNRERYF